MTSTTASNIPSDDANLTDEFTIDIDALEIGSGQIHTYCTASPLISTDTIFLHNVDAVTQLPQALALHQEDEIRRHDQAEPEPDDIHHAVMEEILRNQNNTPDVSKKLLEITGKSIASLLQLANQSPGGTNHGPLLKVVGVTLCMAHILLLSAIIVQEWMPRAAKVAEKAGLLAIICSILLLMWRFIA